MLMSASIAHRTCIPMGAGVANAQFRPSRPVPIKKCNTSRRAMTEGTCTDYTKEYDWATWRMYTRITTARLLRGNGNAYSVRQSVHQRQQQQTIATQGDIDDIDQERVDHQVDSVRQSVHQQQQQKMIVTQGDTDDIDQERVDHQVDSITSTRGLQQQPSLEDGLLDGGVFILDMPPHVHCNT